MDHFLNILESKYSLQKKSTGFLFLKQKSKRDWFKIDVARILQDSIAQDGRGGLQEENQFLVRAEDS